MLFRFSLYGFLKNLRIYDAFLLIALLDRGLGFAAVGWLFAIREATVLCLEIPSGAVADAVGRKRSLVASMSAYVASAVVLGFAPSFWGLALGMSFGGIGDAFRSGTHKALIYAWLRREGRLAERTKVYGYTRSWSKLGSACSALVGGAILWSGAGYQTMFVAGALVALANAVNLATYPDDLDEKGPDDRSSMREAINRLASAFRQVRDHSGLRSRLTASAIVEGSYASTKVYLQPVLHITVLGTPLLAKSGHEEGTGLVLGAVSAALFVAGSVASRRAHTFERRFGSAGHSSAVLAAMFAVAYGLTGAFLAIGWPWPAVLVFVAMGVMQNLWRPLQVGRFHGMASSRETATILSIDSQSRSLFAAVLAPVMGVLVDHLAAGRHPAPLYALAPIAILTLPLMYLARLEHRGAGCRPGGTPSED